MPEIDAILAYHVWLAESRTRKMAIPTKWRSDSDHKLRRVPRPLRGGAAYDPPAPHPRRRGAGNAPETKRGGRS
nr:MAG TPA: hypothetical protein [Caudoviricetes sp.]